jgi:hypothetical protein
MGALQKVLLLPWTGLRVLDQDDHRIDGYWSAYGLIWILDGSSTWDNVGPCSSMLHFLLDRDKERLERSRASPYDMFWTNHNRCVSKRRD